MTGTLTTTSDNYSYIHYFYIDCEAGTVSATVIPTSAGTKTFSMTIPADWASTISNHINGLSATIRYQMQGDDGQVGAEESKAITLVASGLAPYAGTLYVSYSNTYNGYVLQNYTSCT